MNILYGLVQFGVLYKWDGWSPLSLELASCDWDNHLINNKRKRLSLILYLMLVIAMGPRRIMIYYGLLNTDMEQLLPQSYYDTFEWVENSPFFWYLNGVWQLKYTNTGQRPTIEIPDLSDIRVMSVFVVAFVWSCCQKSKTLFFIVSVFG